MNKENKSENKELSDVDGIEKIYNNAKKLFKIKNTINQ